MNEQVLAAFDSAIPDTAIAGQFGLRDVEYLIATLDTMAIADETDEITGGATAYAAVLTAFERWRPAHPARALELQVLARHETFDPVTGEGLPRVIVTAEDRKGRKIHFYDTVDKVAMTLADFVTLIEQEDGRYRDLYHIKNVHGRKTPFALPDQLLSNNLEPP